MAAATKASGSSRSERGFWPGFWSERFYAAILTLSSLLLLCGAGGFLYLESNSPLSLVSGSDHSVAAATLFVPSQSNFSVSLLVQPQKLVAFLQALENPGQREQTVQEIDQIKQRFLDKTGFDYEQTIQPWLGDEVTFAYTVADLDIDPSNGQQPGYLVAAEIAPNQQQQAKEFLQLFWQQQALSGDVPNSEKVSGVRILSSSSSPLVKATALVGEQFVLFANDVRVLRRSIQVAQTAENLAQNMAYRKTVAALPKTRIGLAYFDLNLLNDTSSNKSFAAASLGLARTGVIAKALPTDSTQQSLTAVNRPTELADSLDTLALLPADSEIVIGDHNLTRLRSDLVTVGLSAEALPALLQPALQQQTDDTPWSWATGDYALGKLDTGRSQDWGLVVERDEAGIAALDQYAITSGYSKVPVSVGDATVTAWTRLSAAKSTQRLGSELETELLGLHLQQDRYEIFTDSLRAMSKMLAASEPLVESPRFKQATDPLSTTSTTASKAPSKGYIYFDWPTVAPALNRKFRALDQVATIIAPAFSHIDTVAATRQSEALNIFVHLRESS